jgi:hypothetical protein
VLTRRLFHASILFISGAAGTFERAYSQNDDKVTIRIRVDESVRQSIPPLVQRNLTIERDQSEEANELIRRSPPARAVPVIFIIVGAMAVPVVLQMVREALRQIYYGGVLIDMRTQPPTVTSDPRVPGNMIFLTDSAGKTSQFTSDQLNPALLAQLLKAN